jgi:hypothetical protein
MPAQQPLSEDEGVLRADGNDQAETDEKTVPAGWKREARDMGSV